VIDERPMSDSATPSNPQSLSPRAGVAVMTLQLRNILQEAVAAEAEVASLDVDAAVWQLRARLGPLIEDRKQALAEELHAEEQRAEVAVEAARVEAAEIVRTAHERAAEAEARREADEARRRTMLAAEAARAATAAAAAVAVEAEPESAPTTALFDDPLVEEHPEIPTPADSFPPPVSSTVPPPPAPLVLAMPEIIEATSAELLPPTADDLLNPDQVDLGGDLVDAELIDGELVDDLVADDSTMWAEHPPVPASTIRLPVTAVETDGSVPAVAGQSQPMHVVIDADSFGRAFAAAMAPVLATLNQGSTQGQYPPPGWVPMQAPPAKKSFWAHAWHPDVLLSGLAMVIVIIVLIAWTG
jgi:hypothetical protein